MCVEQLLSPIPGSLLFCVTELIPACPAIAPSPNRSAKPPTATASTTTAAAEKDSSSSSSGDTNSTTTDSSESKSQSGATAAVSSGKSRHKWPLRPGVHVHVKGLHAMHQNNNGKGDDEDGDGDGGPSPHPGATASRGTSTSNRAVSCGGEADSVAAASTASDDVVDDGRAGKTSQGMRDRLRLPKFSLCLARIPCEWALAERGERDVL